jgi:hypothetical protein
MRKIITLFLCMLSFTCFAAPKNNSHSQASFSSCPQAVATTDSTFCGSFKSVAYCHCMEGIGSPDACSDMNEVYQFMIDYYTTLENACHNQTDVDYQTCVDDWNCYRNGGTNSQGGLCSATGSACQ